MKLIVYAFIAILVCLSPCGERGLKCVCSSSSTMEKSGRSPCGERGLKYQLFSSGTSGSGRSPCGERGLKSRAAAMSTGRHAVAPRAGSVG